MAGRKKKNKKPQPPPPTDPQQASAPSTAIPTTSKAAPAATSNGNASSKEKSKTPAATSNGNAPLKETSEVAPAAKSSGNASSKEKSKAPDAKSKDKSSSRETTSQVVLDVKSKGKSSLEEKSEAPDATSKEKSKASAAKSHSNASSRENKGSRTDSPKDGSQADSFDIISDNSVRSLNSNGSIRDKGAQGPRRVKSYKGVSDDSIDYDRLVTERHLETKSQQAETRRADEEKERERDARLQEPGEMVSRDAEVPITQYRGFGLDYGEGTTSPDIPLALVPNVFTRKRTQVSSIVWQPISYHKDHDMPYTWKTVDERDTYGYQGSIIKYTDLWNPVERKYRRTKSERIRSTLNKTPDDNETDSTAQTMLRIALQRRNLAETGWFPDDFRMVDILHRPYLLENVDPTKPLYILPRCKLRNREALDSIRLLYTRWKGPEAGAPNPLTKDTTCVYVNYRVHRGRTLTVKVYWFTDKSKMLKYAHDERKSPVTKLLEGAKTSTAHLLEEVQQRSQTTPLGSIRLLDPNAKAYRNLR